MKRLVLVAMLLTVPALAQVPTVTAAHAWARATSPSQTVGGVFLTLTAAGAADRLVAVTSPVATMVELHETVKDGDVMRMRPVSVLLIEPGHATELKPGGYHLMMMGLKQPLTVGASFPVTLTFEKAPPLTTTVTVQAAGASEMMHMHSHTP
jgi:copper(I)-binding protein